MDAIRKKMQSLKGETDGLYLTINRLVWVTLQSVSKSAMWRHKNEGDESRSGKETPFLKI